MQSAFNLRDVHYREILSIPFLEIPEGSLFGITGKSGSGKTTLLRLLNNMLSPETGQICYFGKNILEFDPVDLRRRVVMVPQSPYIFPRTVQDNIRLAFYFNRKALPAQDEIKQLLLDFSMPEMIDRETITMSGGEKQRLAMVRALLLDPETLLLDEPTAALDNENAKAVISYLAQWANKTGKTVVIISHDGVLISEYADNILRLSGGSILSLEESRGADVF